MMPLPSRLPVPYGYEHRDRAAQFARLELRDGGAWLLAPARAPEVRTAREVALARPAGRVAKVARALSAFFL